MLVLRRIVGKQASDVGFGVVIEAWHERIESGVGVNVGRVDIQFAPPNQTRLLTEIDDPLEEPCEGVDAEPLADAGQAGVVREVLVEGVAEIPAMRQVEAGHRNELALGANALK